MQIIPAIMPKTFDELHELVGLGALVSKIVQVDIMDGIFVPSTSWPYSEKGFKNKDFQALMSQENGLPLWEKIDYEFDLMIDNPISTMEQWTALGPKRIIVHYDAMPDPRESLRAMQELRPFIEIALAVGAHHSIQKIEPLVPLIDSIQCMGIEKIGFQGQPFHEKILETISEIKTYFPELVVSVDGSVNRSTIAPLASAGAARVAVGSALLVGDMVQNFKELKQVLEDTQSMIK
jgi:ribulose-phosphate 3-epimerase